MSRMGLTNIFIVPTYFGKCQFGVSRFICMIQLSSKREKNMSHVGTSYNMPYSYHLGENVYRCSSPVFFYEVQLTEIIFHVS